MTNESKNPKRDSFVAAGWNLVAGAVELAAGGAGSSLALIADTAHNAGDAAAYGINGLTAERDWQTHYKWRRRAAALVVVGALAIGLKSGHESVFPDSERPGPVVPATAVVAGAINYGVHRRMKHHGHLTDGYADNAIHAKWDAYCAPVTIATTTLASLGIPRIDSVGGAIVSGIAIYVNRPKNVH